MAFNVAAAGADGGQILAGAVLSPLSSVAGRYNVADGISWEVLNANGSRIAGGQEAAQHRVNSLILNISAGGTALAAYADATVDGSAADTGVLTTAAAAANQHAIPANFGPGRGNWTNADMNRLDVDVEVAHDAYSPAGDGSLIRDTRALIAGNVVLTFKNMSVDSLDAVNVYLHYRHSATL